MLKHLRKEPSLQHPNYPKFLLFVNKDINKLSDDELIEGGIRQDQACLGALYSRYFKRVHQQCLGFVKDPQVAFDLTQDILLKSFSHLSAFKGNASFSSWLWTIGNNHCKDYSRTIKRHPLVPLSEEGGEGIPRAEETDKEVDWTQWVLPLLERLTENERKLLIQKYVNGTSIQELQHIYQLSESAIKMRLSRAKESLLFYSPKKNKACRNSRLQEISIILRSAYAHKCFHAHLIAPTAFSFHFEAALYNTLHPAKFPHLPQLLL